MSLLLNTPYVPDNTLLECVSVRGILYGNHVLFKENVEWQAYCFPYLKLAFFHRINS